MSEKRRMIAHNGGIPNTFLPICGIRTVYRFRFAAAEQQPFAWKNTVFISRLRSRLNRFFSRLLLTFPAVCAILSLY
ncbi:MAG: hypothetical protein MJ070_11610 [Lachnospiraceae bacterium]|nr:hypothetical protein [Lachnospiraceae bacterium]